MTTTPPGEREPGQELCGLAAPEAERRLAEHGPNEVAEVPSAPLHSRVLAQLRDPLIMVLLGAALLTIVIGDHPDAVVIGLVIVFNTTVGVAQEIRADHAVAALSTMSAPSARVLRDGTAREVAEAVVVPGDVLLLGEGDIVAADAELIEASGASPSRTRLMRHPRTRCRRPSLRRSQRRGRGLDTPGD
ncbi:cation-transporting P-type ATPase [Streptomyces sp. NBC_00846]|uniref:cation-transporting P-type ATPase n=1 Tax=Streptomyces sp. NBC_00846 TaxID=2975849 RepID=UPI0038704003|nr:cation-transporting P-type ATPase [Streptomyces sp. NBC_00846]